MANLANGLLYLLGAYVAYRWADEMSQPQRGSGLGALVRCPGPVFRWVVTLLWPLVAAVVIAQHVLAFVLDRISGRRDAPKK